jgi:hypothetical protein
VFEKRELRKLFGLKKNEVMGGWRKLHNVEVCNISSSPNIIKLNAGK